MLRWTLTSMVLAVATGAAAVVVFALARSAAGSPDGTLRLVPFVASGAAGIVVASATLRRIDSAVVALVDGVDDQEIAAIAVIGHDAAAELGPDRYLSDLAATAASLLRVPFVGFDIDPVSAAGGQQPDADPDGPTWSSRLRASHGATGRPMRTLARPVRLGASEIGRIDVGSRAGGRELSADDVAAIDAIARQAAMVISNARHAEALHQSRERAVSAIEEERRRLRRDLHDELGPNLAAMKLRLGVLRRSGELTPAAASIVDELAQTVDATTADVRRLVEDLRPPLLDDLGLRDALRCLGFVPEGLDLTVESADDLEDLPAATQAALYRIGSEAIRNVVRHADASTCTVRLRRTEADVTLTVLDDGRGIDHDRPAGVGLTAMRERADELGGLVTLSSGAGRRGCCVAATIPLRPAIAQTVSHPAADHPT